jgi:hypothetical protein
MRFRFHGGALLAPAIALLPSLSCPTTATAEPAKVWPAGPYSFSDEEGGFRITGVSGTGTKADPIVLIEELDSATPVTLTIRTIRPIKPFAEGGDYANGILYMRINALNNSGKAWVEFEFELQEILGQPSVFGDGLSFDQRNKTPDNIISSNYARFNRNFEPYDRLLFDDGNVDPEKTVDFEFLITDFTPRWTFYLVQDPRIPSS